MSNSHQDDQQPGSICILRLSAIGDVCHGVAAVQAIQREWPGASITWVIGGIEYALLKGLPGVEFIVFDKKAGISGYLALRREMKDRHFDILLHMQVAFRASLATLFISADQKWGFDTARAKEGQWLFTNHRIEPQSEPHVAEGFMAFTRAIGIPPQKPAWNMPIHPSDSFWQRKHLGDMGKYIVIAAAASKKERNWLPDRYARCADYARKHGYEVILCGGPSDMEKELASQIIRHCSSAPHNLVGKTTLKQLLCVIREAKLVLAPDTGPVHMAVTTGTPVIGLYAHSNPKRTGPLTRQNLVVSVYEEVLREQKGKSSCDLPWGIRVKGANLMERIEVPDVITRMSEVFSEQNKKH